MKGQLLLGVSCLLSMVLVTAGQIIHVPPPRCAASYAKFQNKFYIYGGSTSIRSDYFSELHVLDLSKHWNSTSPVWWVLTSGPLLPATTATMSLDGKKLLLIPGLLSPGWIYSFEKDGWDLVKANFRNSTPGAFPVTMGTDGKVLITGGIGNAFGKLFIEDYDIYSFEDDKTTTLQLPATLSNGPTFMPSRQGYGAVWSSFLKKVVLYGGQADSITSTVWSADTVSMYDPVAAKWSEVKTTNYNNNTIARHCMAITDDGKRVISYGGHYVFNRTAFLNPDIHILDLETNIWKKGSVLPGGGRYDATCTVAGDYFLLWSGRDLNYLNDTIDFDKQSTPVHIYQISTDKWVQNYIPSADYINPPPVVLPPPATTTVQSSPKPTSDPVNSDGSPSTGVIVGSTIGSVALLSLIGFFVWRHRRSEQRRCQSSGDARSPKDGKDKSEISHSDMADSLDADAKYPNGHTANQHTAHPSGLVPHYPEWGTNYEEYAAEVSMDPEGALSATTTTDVQVDPNTPRSARMARAPSAVGEGFIAPPTLPRSPSMLCPSTPDEYVSPPPAFASRPTTPSGTQPPRNPQYLDPKSDTVAQSPAPVGEKEPHGPQWAP
ncbi:hypothetical protein BGZ73_005897 [Actinomortierella ambigua]|nr:hypothetical protein BGZ73_005897 [Actinomortierella ambigua]